MFEIVYLVFYYIMIFEVAIFLFLTLPIPKGWKAAIFSRISNSTFIKSLIKIQIIICLIAVVFYFDSNSTERKFVTQKNKLLSDGSIGAGKSVVT
jgi:hypothetical protein